MKIMIPIYSIYMEYEQKLRLQQWTDARMTVNFLACFSTTIDMLILTIPILIHILQESLF